MPIHVLLADDEPLARRRLLRFLRAESEVEIAAECATGAEAVAALAQGGVDLALLDVQMPDLDGFGVIAEVGPERMPPVVFVTAYDAYALRAFEVHALDYLLKPVTAERFREAFARARAHLERANAAEMGRRLRAMLAQVLEDGGAAGVAGAASAALAGEPASGGMGGAAPRARPVDRLTIKAEGRVYFLRAADVDWVEAHGNHVKLHVGKQVHLLRETVVALEGALDPRQFARIHRGTIVNLDRIRELQPWFAGDYLVLLKDGTQLKLSRTYREQLQQRLHALS
jgi:two-component system LytT family response regulator